MAADGRLNFDTKINKEGFDKGVKNLDSGLGKLQGQFKKLAALAATAFSVHLVASFAKECKELYNTQVEQETKLATIMKQRMAATDEQIESVKKLAAEQQKLGVIGDEVQLAGAQQIATFSKQTSTIETLLPAMNDLLAQQNGLNATTSDAVNIGNLMGKVLQGQTSALKRVGISFSDAEEQVLKYGTEEEKAAMLAQVITNNVGHMNAALAQTDAGKQKQLANAMGDVKEQFGAAVMTIESVFLPLLTKVVQGLAEIAVMAQTAANAIKRAFGMDTKNNSAEVALTTASAVASAAESYEDIEDAAEGTEKAQKKSLASFDKMNILSSDKDSAAGKSGGASALSPAVTVSDNFSETSSNLQDFIDVVQEKFAGLANYLKKNFAPSFTKVWKQLKPELKRFGDNCKTVFKDVKSLGPDLTKYLKGDFTTYLRTFVETSGNILAGLFNSANTVFSDVWNKAAFPMLQAFIRDGLPMFTQFATQSLLTCNTLFTEMKEIFDMLWNDAAGPVLELIGKVFSDLMTDMKAAWDTHGAVVFEAFRTAIKTTGKMFKTVWKTILKPIFDTMMSVVDELWEKHLRPLVQNLLDFAGKLAKAALDIYNNFIGPLVNWFVNTFGPPITAVFNGIISAVGDVLGCFTDLLSGAIRILGDLIDFLTNVFKGNWSGAWYAIKDIFKTVWDMFTNIVKTPINAIIDIVNGFINGLEACLNAVIGALNKISVKIPKWVPKYGGEKFGIDLAKVDFKSVPKLAEGTVIPANFGNFLAMLGDNKREPEVVSPLSTIEQAVKNALGKSGNTEPIHVHVEIDGREIGRVAVNAVNADRARKGA